MSKYIIIPALTALLLLSSCLPEKFSITNENPVSCYEVLTFAQTMRAPMKINKCTGETWILLNNPVAKEKDELTPGYYPLWYFVGTSNDAAVYAGKKMN